MRGERTEKIIRVSLSREEVFQVMYGKTVEERLGVTFPDSKVEVSPLSK